MLTFRSDLPRPQFLEDPTTAFVWMLAVFLRAEKGHDNTVASTKVLFHEGYTVARRRMIERLLLGCRAHVSVAFVEPPNYAFPYAWPGNPGPGIGHWSVGKVALIVGDRTSASWRDRASWSFISGLRSGSSAWLAGQLEHAGVPESALYWVNAYSPDGTPNDHAFIDALQPAGIFALGRNAAHWVSQVTSKYHQVHHPQHWHVYHSTKKYILPSLIKKELVAAALL